MPERNANRLAPATTEPSQKPIREVLIKVSRAALIAATSPRKADVRCEADVSQASTAARKSQLSFDHIGNVTT
jgi:hypothetical protein